MQDAPAVSGGQDGSEEASATSEAFDFGKSRVRAVSTLAQCALVRKAETACSFLDLRTQRPRLSSRKRTTPLGTHSVT